MSLLLAGLLSLCSLWTDSQGVTWSFPNLLSGSFARLSLCKCHRESFHLCEQRLGLGVAPAEHRCCQCEGAGAPGDVSAAFSVRRLFAKLLFFSLPQGQIFKEYMLQAWVCWNTGFSPVSTDMQKDKEVPQRNQVTLRSGREQIQGLDLGFSKPGPSLACWHGAQSMP